MTTAKTFLLKLEEAQGRLVKEIAIRDGRKQVVYSREYPTECPEGYKRDNETGACVRMSAEERRNRSKAATKAANKSSTKRNKAISINRRKSLVHQN